MKIAEKITKITHIICIIDKKTLTLQRKYIINYD